MIWYYIYNVVYIYILCCVYIYIMLYIYIYIINWWVNIPSHSFNPYPNVTCVGSPKPCYGCRCWDRHWLIRGTCGPKPRSRGASKSNKMNHCCKKMNMMNMTTNSMNGCNMLIWLISVDLISTFSTHPANCIQHYSTIIDRPLGISWNICR